MSNQTATSLKRNHIFWVIFLAFVLTSCVAEPPAKSDTQTLSDCSLKAAQQSQVEVRKIASAQLKTGTGNSTPVISNAQKFIIPVPAWAQAGEPLVYPQGSDKAGQVILDYEGKPIGDRGFVFFNGKDKSWQAVSGDGNGVIIINEVTQNQAQQLYQKIQEFQPDPNNLTLAQFKQVIDFAQKQLGLVDMYNSTRTFIKEKMTPAIAGEVPKVNGKEVEAYGFKKRDDRDVNQAIYIPGRFVFEGPAASPQEFAEGGVIVEQGGKMRGVQPDIFVRTYRLSDGRPISAVTDLKTQCN
ncbi:MAG TPA: hypothetical protein IGS53_23620 [Leptolyngbyaceae cyanobacterium M33_DOE_097]|uniref:Uncharacterized protein n=1 Tax=Oscillatoriales cyanobacterium SpSt-418 TaxID=2282169 RepID=A0A7C3PCE4_9CYAN|nr:hypothetical protein [Leptolyngbyaceae cyanobacterium M33_DOE_097]